MYVTCGSEWKGGGVHMPTMAPGFCRVTRSGCTEQATWMGHMWSQEWAFPLEYQESRASFP